MRSEETGPRPSLEIEQAGNGGFVVLEAPTERYIKPKTVGAYSNVSDLISDLPRLLGAEDNA